MRPSVGRISGRPSIGPGVLRGELVRWTGWRGLFHLVFWLLMIDGWLYFTVVTEHRPFGGLGFESLMRMQVLFVPLAAIILTEATLVGELRGGIAAWTISKPVPRAGYVVSKLTGLWIGLSVTAVFIPGLAAYWWLPRVEPLRFVTPEAPALGRFLGALLIVSLTVAFFIALTAVLGVSIRRRGVVALIALFAYAIIRQPPRELWSGWDSYTPAGLIGTGLGGWDAVTEYVYGNPLGVTTAVVWTIVVTLAFMVGASMIYQRLEL